MIRPVATGPPGGRGRGSADPPADPGQRPQIAAPDSQVAARLYPISVRVAVLSHLAEVVAVKAALARIPLVSRIYPVKWTAERAGRPV